MPPNQEPWSDRPRNEGSREDATRSAHTRDADRILYSEEFRRLAGVTQVTSPQEDFVYHDRLTHSLKVAQVGASIASRLRALTPEAASGPIDPVLPEAVRAAALAHDLGHPPFGHIAEDELQKILAGRVDRHGKTTSGPTILEDSFEGNAQTFRIVTRLSFRKAVQSDTSRSPETSTSHDHASQLELLNDEEMNREIEQRDPEQTFPGLNLTWATLFAIQKYPWLHNDGPAWSLDSKWGFYNSERGYLDEMRARYDSVLGVGTRSINAQLMDWADDVAYAIHDTEDFYRAGLIPLERLKVDDAEWARFREFAADKATRSVLKIEGADRERASEVVAEIEAVKSNVFALIREDLPRDSFDGSRVAHSRLHAFATTHIDSLTKAVELRPESVLFVPVHARFMAEALKALTHLYVINTPMLHSAQVGQRQAIRELFFALWDIVRMDASLGRSGPEAHIPVTTLPARLWEYCSHAITDESMRVAGTRDAQLARAVVDFLCSLTDKQALLLRETLAGRASGRTLGNNWLAL